MSRMPPTSTTSLQGIATTTTRREAIAASVSRIRAGGSLSHLGPMSAMTTSPRILPSGYRGISAGFSANGHHHERAPHERGSRDVYLVLARRPDSRARTGVQGGRAGSTLDRKAMDTDRELMARMARGNEAAFTLPGRN